MSSLRNLLDGKAVDIRAGDDVYKHLEQTKKAQLKYDIAKAKLHTKLAPARKMMELVDQEHPVDENNGNPDNLQNPQVDQNGRPIPNQAAPTRPGIGQQQNNQQPIQKKPAFSNVSKTSTSSKLAKDKDNKAKAKGKGVEIHVKAGGPGSGRHSTNRYGSEKMLRDVGYKIIDHNDKNGQTTFRHPDHKNEHIVVNHSRWLMKDKDSGSTIEKGTHRNNDDLHVMIHDRPHDEE